MSLILKNSYSRSLQEFQPRNNQVTMYTCGPTVYSYAHIGNFRSFLMADLLRRVLEMQGYDVRHVMNITDVGHLTNDDIADAFGEDKLEKSATELGCTPYEIASHFEKAFIEDAKLLRLKNYQDTESEDETLHPKASQHIVDMLVMILSLYKAGYVYLDQQGQAYFDVNKFPEYGQLSNKDLNKLNIGSSVAIREEKKDPRDFALWKVDSKHLMQWDPHSDKGWTPEALSYKREKFPNGYPLSLKSGFPGWHIECSAMALRHLGEEIDIHTGGEDNIFPHHECEIAQTYGSLSTFDRPKSFARYWVHGRHLLVNGKKMSKRDGTFFTVRNLTSPSHSEREDLIAPLEQAGFSKGIVPAVVLRYALLSVPYTQPMNFTFELLTQAKVSVERIQNFYSRFIQYDIFNVENNKPIVKMICDQFINSFNEALCDNLNTSNALAVLFGFMSEINKIECFSYEDANNVKNMLERMNNVFDILELNVICGFINHKDESDISLEELLSKSLCKETIELFLKLRNKFKREFNYAQSDNIRDFLKQKNVILNDVFNGTCYKII